MKVTRHYEGNGTRLSFELLPPLRGSSIESVYGTIDRLVEFNPACINITYHREEKVTITKPGGTRGTRVVKKRPGTVGIAAAIQHKYGIDVVPHIICGGFTRQDTEDALIDLDFLGIHNLLVIRGDGNRETGVFEPEEGGHAHAVDLVCQIMDMNRGIYLDNYINDPAPTAFSVGVAGYPEKHYEAPDMKTDLEYLKMKVDAGAEYIVTQMFFDNRVYFEFVRRCRESGISVPVIPGLKPVAIKRHLDILPDVFGVTIPQELAGQIRACKSDKDVYSLGIEWASMQSAQLKGAGVPAIHYYTMSRPDNIVEIVKRVF
ncbi:MAG: methylenetetrahydrofolate reductase [NAD(P)H] [Marinilabiliales bacterium]|nr:MAG: methylenetetrahydrofolate reductase [NAD(P)H] [Marinilabiliales bacterium]